MKKLILCSLFIVQLGFAISDTSSTEVITPGVIHTQYTLPGPYTLDVLEVDINNPYLTFETSKPNGLTKTTVQAASLERDGHRVIGAINGDFFSFETGWPIHNQVVNGFPVIGISSKKSAFIWNTERQVFIDGVSFGGSVVTKNAQSIQLDGVNIPRSSGTILYTAFYGSTTNTNSTGAEMILFPIENEPNVNDTVLAIVHQKGSGNLSIPKIGYVVSASSGADADVIVNSVNPGDTVRLIVDYRTRSSNAIQHVRQIISGNGRIIKDGVPYPAIGDYDQSGTSFNEARHPRTFLGINSDTTKVYLCTVDGRQASSIGMSFSEMATFLSSIGVTNAFNFDGGGSTTMVVRGNVVNSPSDPGGERSVANALMVISTAPTGTLHTLGIRDSRVEIFQGKTHAFFAEGRDEFLNPIPLPSGVRWHVDQAIGSVDSVGVFTAAHVNDSAWISVSYGTIKDSAFVVVRVIKELVVQPRTLIMLPGERLSFRVRGIDTGDRGIDLHPTQVQYRIEGNSLDVSSEGIVTSTGFGSGKVIIMLDSVMQYIPYTSQVTDTTIVADDFSRTQFWRYNVSNTDPDNIFFSSSWEQFNPNPPALQIRFLAPPASVVHLQSDIYFSSSPDSISLNVYGDGGNHAVQLLVEDREGEQFIIDASSRVTWNNNWNTLRFGIVNAKPVSGGAIDYPISIRQITITLGDAGVIGGLHRDTIYVDDIRAHYPKRNAAPDILVDFNSGISGWLTPSQSNSAQLVGINIGASKLEWSQAHPYEGAGCGKWTLVDDVNSTSDWSVRIPRATNAEVGSMLRGSYIGAWIWSEGKMDITLRTVIRDGNGQICAGPAFPVNHIGWKLIGTRLLGELFTPYLTSGKITDANNKFNGFRVQANAADVNGKTKIFYVDKMVTSALTVPTGFIDFNGTFDSVGHDIILRWKVNSEISINRYEIDRSEDGNTFQPVASVQAVGNHDTTLSYEYTDHLSIQQSMLYRITQYTNDGAQTRTPNISVIVTGADRASFQPAHYVLYQNFPNPCNPSTTIEFSIPRSENVTLKIFDVLGRELETLIDRPLDAGKHVILWNAQNNSSGMYLYRIQSDGFMETKKMVVMK